MAMPGKRAGGLYTCLLFVWNFLLMDHTANSMETITSFTATILQTSQKPTNTISMGSTSQILKGSSSQSPNSLIGSTNLFNSDLTSTLVLTPSFNGVSTPFSPTATSVLATTTRVLSQPGSSHSPLISNSTANVYTAIPTTVTPTVITSVMSDLTSVQTSANSITENMSKISTSLDLDFTALAPTPLLKSVSMISTTTALFSTGISPKIEPRNSMLTYSLPPIINTTLPIPATLTVARIGRSSTANVSRTVRSTVITSVMSNLFSVQTSTNPTIGNQLTSTPDLHGNQSSVSTIARIGRNSTTNVSRTVRSTVITSVMSSNLSSVQTSTNPTIGNQLTSTPVSTPSLNTVSIKSPSSTTITLSGTMIEISSETRVRNPILTFSAPTINITSITPSLPITATLGSDLRGNQSSINSTTMISIFSSAKSSSVFFLTRSRTAPSTITTSVMSNLSSVQTGANSTIGNTSKISTSLVFTLAPVSTPLLNSVTMISPPSTTTALLSTTAISSKIVPRNSTLPSLSRTIINVTPILPSLQISTIISHLSENQSLVSANKTIDRNSSTATVFLETPRAVRSTVITPVMSSLSSVQTSTNSAIGNQLNMSATYGLTSTPVSTSSLNPFSIISPSTTTTLSSTMIGISSEFRTRNLTAASSPPTINVTSITPSLPISATQAPDPHGNQSSVNTTTLFSLFSSAHSSLGFFLTRSRTVPSTVITSVMSNLSSVKTSANSTIGNTSTSLDFTSAPVSTPLLKTVSMISPSSTTTILLSFTRVSSKIEAKNYTLPSSPPTIINVTSITPSLPISATLTPHPSGNQSSVGAITIIGTNSTGTVFLDTSRAELSTITTSVMSKLSSVQTNTNSTIGNMLNMSATYSLTSTLVSTSSLNPFSIISPSSTTRTLSSTMIEISSETRAKNSTLASSLPTINVTSITPSPISATLTPDLQGNKTRSVNSTTLVSLFSITNSTAAFFLTRSRTVPSTIVTSMLSNLSSVQTSSTSTVKNTSKIPTSYNFTSAIFSRPSSVNLMSPSSVRDSNETVSITALTPSYTVRLGSSVSNKTLVQRTLSTFGVSTGPSSTVTMASRNLSSLPITSESSTIVSVSQNSTVTLISVALIVSSSLNANVTLTPQLTSKPIFTTRIRLPTTRVSSEIRSNYSSLVFSQSSINVTSIIPSLPISATSTPDLHGNQSSVSTIARIGRNSTTSVSRTVRSTIITSVMSNLSSVQTSTNPTIGNQLTSTPVSTPSLSPVSNISSSSTARTLASTIQALSETRARNSTLASSLATINVTSITPSLPISATLTPHLTGNKSSVGAITTIGTNSTAAVYLETSRTVPPTVMTSVMSNLSSAETGTNSTIGNQLNISATYVFTSTPVSTPSLSPVSNISSSSTARTLSSTIQALSETRARNSTLASSPVTINVTSITPSLPLISATLTPHLTGNQSSVGAITTFGTSSTFAVSMETSRTVPSTVITSVMSNLSSVQTSSTSTVKNTSKIPTSYNFTSAIFSRPSSVNLMSPSSVRDSNETVSITALTPSYTVRLGSSVSNKTLVQRTLSTFGVSTGPSSTVTMASRNLSSLPITSESSTIVSVSQNSTVTLISVALIVSSSLNANVTLTPQLTSKPIFTTRIRLPTTRVSSEIRSNYSSLVFSQSSINVTSIIPSLPISATSTPDLHGNQSSVSTIARIGRNSTTSVSRTVRSTIITSVMSNLSSVQTSTNPTIGNQLTSTPVSTPSLSPVSNISSSSTARTLASTIQALSETRARNSTLASSLATINVTSITPSLPISATLTPHLTGNKSSVGAITTIGTNSTAAVYLETSRTVPPTVMTSVMSNLSSAETGTNSTIGNQLNISATYVFTSTPVSTPSLSPVSNISSSSTARTLSSTIQALSETRARNSTLASSPVTINVTSITPSLPLISATLTPHLTGNQSSVGAITTFGTSSTFAVSMETSRTVPSTVITSVMSNLSSVQTSTNSTVRNKLNISATYVFTSTPVSTPSLNPVSIISPFSTTKTLSSTIIGVSSSKTKATNSTLASSPVTINVTSIIPPLPTSATLTPVSTPSLNPVSIISPFSTTKTPSSTIIGVSSSKTKARNSTSASSPVTINVTSIIPPLPTSATLTPVSTPSLNPVSIISPFSTTKTPSSTIIGVSSSKTKARNSTSASSPVEVTSIIPPLPTSATLTPVSTPSLNPVSITSPSSMTVESKVTNNSATSQSPTGLTVMSTSIGLLQTSTVASSRVSTVVSSPVYTRISSSPYATGTDTSVVSTLIKLSTSQASEESRVSTLSYQISTSTLSMLRQNTLSKVFSYSTTVRNLVSSGITALLSNSVPYVSSYTTSVLSMPLSKSSVSKTIISASQISGITLVSVSYNRTTRMPERSTLHIADASSSQLLPTSQLRSSESQVTFKVTRLSSTMASSSNGLESSHVIATASSSSIQLSSITSDPLSSCHSCSDIVSITAAVSSSILTSRSTLSVSDEYKLQVLLLIPTNVELGDSFKTDMERKLENQYDLGVRQSTPTRPRRAVNKFPMPRHEINRAQKYNDISGDEINVRVKRQTANETTVKILNITRERNSENVIVEFYVSSGGKLVEATSAEKTLNTPSKAETVAELGYQVGGKFSATSSKQVEPGKKKRNETLFIVLAVTLPFLFVLLSCIFIKCKKRKKSKRMKLNKVSVHDAERGDHRNEQASERKSFEERYTRAPELPVKDYAKDSIKKPRERPRSKKEPKPYSVLNTQKENALVTPASAFENITRMSYEGSSNVTTIDEIPLRFRPAFRQDIEQKGKVPTEQDIVEESGVPRSWMEKKQMVVLHGRSDEKIKNNKVSPATEQDGGDSRAKIRTVEEDTDSDSDDTMQIKANIEKWRNKMRQKEKRKEKREERRRLEEDKLIALEQRKLSRRDWLMAQPEIQAILEGEDLPTASSLRKKTYRQKRWRGIEHPSYSESENEGMVVPVRNKKRRRRWPRRAKQVFPAEQDGIRLVSVRPKKQRVYAFEESVVNEPEIDPRYSQPQSESSSVYQRTPSPMIPEGYDEEDNEENSYDNTYEDEYLDPFVPQYHDPRYLEQPVLVPRYLTTSGQTLLQHNLPLRMQETSLTSTPARMSRPLSSDNVNTKHPRTLYYDERHPRPSTLYTSAGRRTKQNFSSEPNTNSDQRIQPPLHYVDNSDGRRTRSNADNLPSAGTARKGNSRVVRNDMETVAERSEPKTVEAEMRNYNISENEAKTLVARVLQRAARNNVHST